MDATTIDIESLVLGPGDSWSNALLAPFAAAEVEGPLMLVGRQSAEG